MLPGGSFKSLEMIFMMHVDEFDHSDITIEVLKKKIHRIDLCMRDPNCL